ncbi:DDRGK domain-containing protein 1 [Trifolium medium]|uniref:DDRGK domain-containing protein 1 n=1 Tax=Trifolium medium TaxID=97028 RepID=A0A392M686_9FABA|nr:DDRGK domain-containing protein 1 [Trifolium medium]
MSKQVFDSFRIVLSIPLYLWKRHHDSRSSSCHEEPQQAPGIETIVHAAATRRMRRRPVASGASTSSTPPALQQGSYRNSFGLI